jgi:dihydrofolate reductase
MKHKGRIIIIAAVAENGVIGRNNALPWSIKEDMIRFKKLTLGFPCIMGRKTYESLPRRPLPGRLNVILSASLAGAAASACAGSALVPAAIGDGAETKICAGLEEALGFCKDYEKIFICGGASVYREALPYAGVIELTRVRGVYEGDAYFPSIDPTLWKESAVEDHGAFSFVTLVRRRI